QTVEASHLVVFAIKKGLDAGDVRRHVERIAELRNTTREALAGIETKLTEFVQLPPPFDVDAWSRRQLYIALGVFLTSAALLGVDACPMEGLDPARCDEILGLAQEGYATVCMATAGRRASDDKYASLAKVRYDARDVIRHL